MVERLTDEAIDHGAGGIMTLTPQDTPAENGSPPNYWGTPKSYPEGTIGHETSDHYKPDTLSDHIWTALMWVAVGGMMIWAAITGISE